MNRFYHTCINLTNPWKYCVRNLSYVERVRYLQELKENPSLCEAALSIGKFIVYNGSKPLAKPFIGNKLNKTSGPTWLTFDDIKDAVQAPIDSCVLLDVSENGIPQYAAQIKGATDDVKNKIEELYDSQYVDLRLALLLSGRKEASLISRSNSLLRWNALNKFCGNCAQKTIKTIVGNSRKCSSCSNVIYPSSSPVGIVLITDPNYEYTLLVRQPRNVKGMYSCVAGFADVGESLEDTVKREVAEEVGLEVSEVHYIASQHWPFPNSLMTGCFAIAEKLEPRLDPNELLDARWYNKEEISGAIARIQKDPLKRIIGSDNESLIVPPHGAIAYHLLYHWLHNTPLKDIQEEIYKS